MLSKHFSDNFRFRIAFHFLLALLPILIFLVAAVEIFLIPPLKNSIEQDLTDSTRVLTNSLRASVSAAIKNNLKAIAETNREIAQQQISLVQQGVISHDEAVKRIKKIFLSQHIGTSGYIYCLNLKGVFVEHPKRELVNVDVTQYAFIRQQLKQKEGYLEYYWKNPGQSKAHPKALYMVYFKPLDWIISVSSYRSEFNELINIKDYRNAVLSVHFGKSGYPFILSKKGRVLIHPELPYMSDIKSLPMTPEVIGKLLSQPKGNIEYTWSNHGKNKPRKKIAVFKIFRKWDGLSHRRPISTKS